LFSSEDEQPGAGRDVSLDREGSAKPGNDPRTRTLVAYEAKRSQAGDRVDEQRQLASWCDAQGLWDQAKNHWEAVIRLDPREESARRRLGYRARQGHLNQSIEDFNRRVIQVLSKTCGVSFGPDPEAWRRWLAERQGKTYLSPESRQKPTLAQVVLPLYSPTYLPVAAPS
jgi:hypothetical protein